MAFFGPALLPLFFENGCHMGVNGWVLFTPKKNIVDGCDMAKLGSIFEKSGGIYESYEMENLSTGARSWVHVEDVGHGQHFVNCIVQFIGHLFYN